MITLRATERFGKPAVFAACCVPLIWLLLQLFEVGSLQLGPNPVEDIQDTLGIWGLRMLWHAGCAFGAVYCAFLQRLLRVLPA